MDEYEKTGHKEEIFVGNSLGWCECLHEAAEPGPSRTANIIMIIGVLPVMSIVGVFFNVINVIVFRTQRNVAARYLAALSCSDIGVCVAGVLVICADSLRAYNFFIDQLFVFLLPKLIPIGLFFQMLSVYITVLAAMDCFYSVYRGTYADRKRERLAPRVLMMCVFFVAMYNAIQFLDLEARECVHPTLNFSLYELCPTELRISDAYVEIYKGYMYAASMAFIPFILLSFLTIGIISMLKRKESTNAIIAPGYVKEEGSPTVLLLVILLFLLCNVTSLLVNIFDMFKIDLGNFFQNVMIDIGNLLVVFNATANFVVYYFSSREYQEMADGLLGSFVKNSTPHRKKCPLDYGTTGPSKENEFL
ncbi:unnamed protein product, partial [Mesorhabditis belari]|uniref:G-protein coupled receptors family 1 profile domain-containing protein n=1 Tax=Mesorhabditis belari TaxID=2138241 RepID=A0AAF3EYL5_9BILA